MKTIIKLEPEWNGAHGCLAGVDYVLPGWAELTEEFLPTWVEFAPFVDITHENGVITGMSEGTEIVPETPPTPPEQPTPEELAAENALLRAQLEAQSDRADFIEDCIAEMAVQVYSGV